jgi:lipopolysaccharide export LptBFGC system permease protein LptF
LPLSVPLGLAVGAGCTLHGAGRSCKLAIATGVVATVCSCAVFANMAWLTPESNQAFRELLITRLRPSVAFVPRGDNELTFSVLRRRLAEVRASGSRGEVRHFDTLYHGKLATSVATLPVVSVVLGLAFVRRWTRAGLMIAGVGVCAGYYAINATSLYAGSLELVSPVMAAWSANAACTLAAVYFVAVAGVTGWPGRLARRQQSFGR